MKKLVIKNLHKIFNIENKKVKALNNVDLSIGDGEIVTIVGRSGCGKTTLLRILCGLEQKTSGDIEIISKDNNKSNKIGIVFQEPRLMPWLTVEENMAFSLIKNKNKDEVRTKVNKYLHMFGLENFRNAYPAQISGGMAQRVSLGRTMCYDPEIILMDEPLGALDAFNRRKLQNEFINIFIKNDKTIVFVTHDVEEAVYIGQRVIVLENGSVVNDIPIPLDYYRDVTSIKFVKIKEKILNNFRGDNIE